MSSTPLLSDGAVEDAHPALLSSEPLSARQQRQEESIRTLCLVVLSTAVVGTGCYYLRTILVRFVLALALRYLLTPLIDTLSCHGRRLPRRLAIFKMPRGLAIFFAIAIAGGILFVLGLVVASSIGSFAEHADAYGARVQELFETLVNATSRLGVDNYLVRATNASSLHHEVVNLARTHVSLPNLVFGLLGTAGHVVENAVYILLFLAFLLAGYTPRERGAIGDVHSEAEERIYTYIRGKVTIAGLVSVSHALILWAVGLNLWLVFGVLAFWLNFVPNVGMIAGVLLPLPLVLLDPKFGMGSMLFALLGPLGVGMTAKDVLEPLLIGHSTSLTPVAVLLSVMVWGSIWGLTGMVLAVPMTACIRTYLAGLEHPLPRWVALWLAGKSGGDGKQRDSALKPL